MEAKMNTMIGAAALAFAITAVPVMSQAAPVATRLQARRIPSPALSQNRRHINAPRYTAPRRYYHSNRSNYYNNNDTVVVATPYGWQVLNYPTYYYPNGVPYYGPYSGWNSPPIPQPVSPGPPLNLSPLGAAPTQSMLGPIPKAGQSPLGGMPSGSVLHR